MLHIRIQCYPKHLSNKQLSDFSKELTDLIKKHLSANDGDVSIGYKEVQPNEWKTVYDKDVKPQMGNLLKEPGCGM